MTRKQESHASDEILYEHEMVLPESKANRNIRLGNFFLWAIFVLFLVVMLIRKFYLSYMTIILSILIIIALIYLQITLLTYNRRIKMSITNTELFIRAPDGRYRSSSSFINLKFLISREIRHATLINIRNPILEYVLHPNQIQLKPVLNIKLRHPTLKYVFVLSNSYFHNIHHLQFVDLELKDGKHICIEFDDAQNFLDILKNRLSEN